jgi:predicted permease
MKTFSSLRFLYAFFQRSQMNHEMEAELRAHIQLRADDLERSGLVRAEAERHARIEFGGIERYREEIHQAAGSQFFEKLFQDVRYSLRVLRKSPGFTMAAVFTLALGIGANAVVFAALNAVILHPMDLPRLDSLYSVHRIDGDSAAQSYPDYIDLRDRNRSFEDLAAYNITQAGLDTGRDPAVVWLDETSGNYFDVVGIQPYLGRFFHATDEHGSNSAPYIVLSYDFWHSHFQDDRNVVGRVVQLNKHPFTIIGVAAPGFRGTLMMFSPAFFIPLVNQQQLAGVDILNDRAERGGIFMTLGHLKAGVSTAQAAADVNAIWAELAENYPKEHAPTIFELNRPSLYGNHLGRPVRAFLSALMVLAGLILLAACANLGSLFAARAADRSREVALRLALGANRMRILRQLFTEATLISLAGGAIGLWGSLLLMRALRNWQPFPIFPMNLPIYPDTNVYLMALFLALLSGLLFGAVPVRQVLRTDPYEIVKAGSNNRLGRRFTARDLLLMGQIAICALLVTSSMVAVRGLVRSVHSNVGFDPQNVMLVDVDLKMAGYSQDAVPAMQKRMLDALMSLPSVTSAGLINWAPLASGGGNRLLIFADGTADLRPANALERPMQLVISPDYFRAAGTALLSGRSFTLHDDKSSPRVAVVNQQFARKIFGSAANAMGRYYKLRDGTRIQVVGIVEDGKYENLTEDQQPAMFLPILQAPSNETWLLVRANPAGPGSDPQQLAAAVRGKLRNLDAGLPSFIETWRQGMEISLFPARVAAASLGILGIMGAVLSITGIFGMAAYSVSKRMRELGIRMALGAQNKEVLRAALARPFKLLFVGSAAGLILGILASSVLARIVFEATPRDPLILGGVVLAMSLLGLFATWIPAQRALSVNPLMLLRAE